MSAYNKVILLGNCVREPEMRYTPSGAAVTDFRLAVTRISGSGETRKQETLFIDVQAWSKAAETLHRYLLKGSSVLVEGRLVLDQWESNGERRSKIKVVVENFQFIASKQSGGKDTDDRPANPGKSRPDEPPEEDDVPF